MKLRLTLALAIVVGATAFSAASPAPFPKPNRKPAVDDAILLQGTYKVVDYGRPNFNGRAALIRRTQMKIRIQDNKFSYLYQNGNDFVPSTTYEIKLNAKSSPKAIDMTYVTNDYTMTMKGIYKIEGNKVTLVYVSTYSGRITQDGERPSSFENLPPTAMLMTLERE